MKPRLVLLALCVAVLGVSAAAGPQNPPPPPTPPPSVTQSGGGRGVVGGIPLPANQPGRSSIPPTPLVTTSIIVGRVIDPATAKGVSGAIVTLQGGPNRVAPPVQPGTPMTAQGPPPPPPQILTDGEGRFAFMNLTRGNYTLTASKPGYTPGAYGRLRPDGPTRPVQLDDGERMADATIRIFKFASIAGTVIDEAGEPVVSTTVRVYRRVLMSGRRVLSPTGSTVQTDDRGMYRIPNLMPGEYVVAAPMVAVTVPASAQGGGNRPNLQASSQMLSAGSPIPGAGGQALGADNRFLLQRSNGMSGDIAAAMDASGRVTGFSTVYYPNAPTASGAQVFTIASGEERSGIDLAMRRVPTVALSGVISGSEGPAADYVIRLIPTDTGEITQEPEAAVAMSDASGSFMFLAVPSGQYVLQAVRIPRPSPMVIDGPRAPVQISGQVGNTAQALSIAMSQLAPTMEPLLWAMAPVSVSDTDVHGMSLTLREGLTISGRLEFSGTRPRPDPQRLTQVPIVIEPADGGNQTMNMGPPSRVQSDGRFVTTGQLPGKYFIRVGGAPAGWSVQSITANGVDVTDAPIDLSASAGNVVVTFTDLVQDLRGTVTGLTPTSDPPAVIVYPSDSNAWKNFGVNPTRMKMTRSQPTGQFVFGFLPAGDYFVIAIPDEYRGEWQDPAYLDILSRTALRIALSPGERKTLDLTVQDVKPPSIGRRPAPQAVPYSDVDLEGDRREHGPFVATPSTEPAPRQVRDTRTVQPVGGGSISGVVRVDDGSTAPARFARVSVRSSTAPGERIALTDNDGRYSVPGLPAGSYQVYVTKPAYLSMYYGARRPVVAQGLPVRVEAGQAVTGIDVMLKRGGVVTGVVIGADGEPAPGVRVQLLQRVITDGEPRLSGAPSSGASTTDDHGVFRLFGLRPGSYALSATPMNFGSSSEVRQLSDQELRAAMAAATSGKAPAPAGNRILAPAAAGPLPNIPSAGRPVGFAAVYYPGTTVEEQAEIFSLAAGQEIRVGINLQMVPTARIEGTLMTADGQPVPLAGAQVSLQRSTGFSTSSYSIRMVEAGRFQAVGVPPGRYQLIARWTPQVQREPGQPGQPPINNQWFAQQDVEVAGVDLGGITLTLSPPLTFSGKVVFDGPPPAGDAQVQVRLDGAGRTPSGSFARTLKAADNGEFTIMGVTPGRYRLNAFVNVANPAGGPVSTAWAVRSALIDGRDALESPFELQAGRAPPAGVITLSTRLPQLSATITDQSGKAVPNMVFVLFSASKEHWTGNTSRRVRSLTRPNDEGVFQFNSILPGEYYLAVLTDLEPADLYDPSFLEQLVPAAVRITLADGDKKTQNLRIAGK